MAISFPNQLRLLADELRDTAAGLITKANLCDGVANTIDHEHGDDEDPDGNDQPLTDDEIVHEARYLRRRG